MVGKIYLIISMTEAQSLVELLRYRNMSRQKKLLIKAYSDSRYGDGSCDWWPRGVIIKSADTVKTTGESDLFRTIDRIGYSGLEQYKLIFIDDVQDYCNGSKVCLQLADRGHDIITCAHSGFMLQKMLSELLNLNDTTEVMTAVNNLTENQHIMLTISPLPLF